MIRRALIIYCDNTRSGKLSGPVRDNANFREFLTQNIGGDWSSEEIESLRNPTSVSVRNIINTFLSGADYTFIVFTGHGGINSFDEKQYIELMDSSVPLQQLKTTAKRQTIIIDACRGYYTEGLEDLRESKILTFSIGGILKSTRAIFDDGILRSNEGLTILFAASENQTALDTNKGAAYLLSLLNAAYGWENTDKKYNILGLDVVHEMATDYMNNNFDTIQEPSLNEEKRKRYYPFAVKNI
jgi:hypothetical protein